MSRVVYETRARQTGTHVQVIDNRDGRFDCGDENGWFTLCVEHAGVCSHETRRLAEAFASVPVEWCSGCQEARDAADGATDPTGAPLAPVPGGTL